jgi:hypothetical protein
VNVDVSDDVGDYEICRLMVMMLGMSSTLNNFYVITSKLKDLGSQKQQHKPHKS